MFRFIIALLRYPPYNTILCKYSYTIILLKFKKIVFFREVGIINILNDEKFSEIVNALRNLPDATYIKLMDDAARREIEKKVKNMN